MKTPASSPVQPTSSQQVQVEVIEVGVHRKVRVHSCDDIISSDRATLGLFRVGY